MNPAQTARKFHKWLTLIVGVQLMLWVVSGFYMVAVNRDFISGNHLVKNTGTGIDGDAGPLISAAELLQRFTDVESISLKSVMGVPHYLVRSVNGTHLLNAQSGRQLSPIDQDLALAVARYHYAGPGLESSATLISTDPPPEIMGYQLPLWRIDFNDSLNTSFYIDPDTARLVSRRHSFWRTFDLLWMLHIMDYDTRSDINNGLLRGAASLALFTVLAGITLLIYSFGSRPRKTETSGN